jgi:hypothetical protein
MSQSSQQFEFESRLLQISGQEWPAEITEGWEAKPVGCAYFRPSDAMRREVLSNDLILYTISDTVFVAIRFDPITDSVSGVRIVDKAEADEIRKSAPLQDGGAAVYLGDGKLRIGTELMRFEGQKHFVLEALVTLGAATKKQLEDESGCGDAVKILKRLVEDERLAPHINANPGVKGAGGYSTTIRMADG